jgi:Protein of unknown function (DUF3443)
MKWIRPAGVSLCLLLVGCPGDDGGSPAPSGAANVIPVSVGTSNVCTNVNELCASVTICQPGTSTCQTISDILVDIGSVGFRVFGSVLSITLQQAVDAQGRPLGDCALLADGSATWGPVQVADVVLGGGPPVNVPIQVILPTFAGQTVSNNPCQDPVDADPSESFFNGILGIGVFKQDCGPVCAVNANNTLYFSCSGSSCTNTTMPVLNQLQNPVWMLSSGNNGVALTMPTVPANGAPSTTGSLIIGIGTADNNTPPAGISVLTTDTSGFLNTVYKGNTLQTIIDSGSNGLFFPDASIPICAAPLDAFYCPVNPTTLNLMATLVGFGGVIFNGSQVAVPFQVGNTANLVQTNNAALNNLAGPFSIFDWGLPFFFGRTVFVGIEDQTSPLGEGPYFAF